MTVFVRLLGANGKTREMRAILDFNSAYCIITRRDATDLGSVEALMDAPGLRALRPDLVRIIILSLSMLEVPLMVLKEVAVGSLRVPDVEAVVHELPTTAGIDFVLGNTFLRHFRITADQKAQVLEIQ